MVKKPVPITIDDMEETARNEADGCCNKKIRGHWLEVIYYAPRGPVDGYFRYVWGKNVVGRQEAINVLASV